MMGAGIEKRMGWFRAICLQAVVATLCIFPLCGQGRAMDAKGLVKAAIDYWRDLSSYSVMEMTIHRPTWERTMTMRVWTKGEKESLVRVIAPPKDEGNGTLLADNKMWTFSPKINRVVKIPSSMMFQSWMGSDFSNNDVARADDLLYLYRHRLIKAETRQGRKHFVIEAIPLDRAPVVWGKEVVTIREDYILMEHAFYDQDMVLVKRMVTMETGSLGGKEIATRQRMEKIEAHDEWTRIVVKEAEFGMDMPNHMFTLSNLRNPRP